MLQVGEGNGTYLACTSALPTAVFVLFNVSFVLKYFQEKMTFTFYDHGYTYYFCHIISVFRFFLYFPSFRLVEGLLFLTLILLFHEVL